MRKGLWLGSLALGALVGISSYYNQVLNFIRTSLNLGAVGSNGFPYAHGPVTMPEPKFGATTLIGISTIMLLGLYRKKE